MNLADIPAGLTIFVDANILLFALTNHLPVVARSLTVLPGPTEGLLELRGRGTG